MKPSLQLKVSQHLTLTPQLQQSIRLLQMSTLELSEEIERQLQENPLLERDEEAPFAAPEAAEGMALPAGEDGAASGDDAAPASEDSHAETAADDPAEAFADAADWSEAAYASSGRQDDDDDDYHDTQAAGVSLADHLLAQLALTRLSERDRLLVRALIEALDEDGYLTQSLEEIAAILPPELELDASELQIALLHLQNLDPTGVGARSPSECLGLQLAALPASRVRDLAARIVAAHLETLAARDFTRLKRLAGGSGDELRAAHDLIKSLDPRPGARFAPLVANYIIPDVVVKKRRSKWQVTLNQEAYPRLRINRLYARLLASQRRGEHGELTGQLQEARWLIKNVQQRFETILRVAQSIVDRQQQFFEHGEVAMRPLVLREIAEVLDLHESTVSRVTMQKYMATPRGVFELKYFFGSSVATESGGTCSATAIRALIKQMVGAEDAKKPLSDNQMAEILGQQGIVVARRTIAKYRETLNIPPANLRKSL